MSQSSAVEFPTERRIHIGLPVANVQRSVDFYRTLFEVSPAKRRDDYAKFELHDPAVNLSLFQVPEGTRVGLPHPGSHFGVQVKSKAAVAGMAQRLEAAGLVPRMQEQVGCCYAVQDKAWVDDPDGNSWEIFVVTDNQLERLAPEPETPCCVPQNEGSGCCA